MRATALILLMVAMGLSADAIGLCASRAWIALEGQVAESRDQVSEAAKQALVRVAFEDPPDAAPDVEAQTASRMTGVADEIARKVRLSQPMWLREELMMVPSLLAAYALCAGLWLVAMPGPTAGSPSNAVRRGTIKYSLVGSIVCGVLLLTGRTTLFAVGGESFERVTDRYEWTTLWLLGGIAGSLGGALLGLITSRRRLASGA